MTLIVLPNGRLFLVGLGEHAEEFAEIQKAWREDPDRIVCFMDDVTIRDLRLPPSDPGPVPQ